MSGQGALFTIANATPDSLEVKVSDVKGMNSVPPGGTLARGAVQGPSYIEATWGPAASEFWVSFGPFEIPFNESGWAYWVNGINCYTENSKGRNVTVAIAQRESGRQDVINIIVY